MDNLYVVLDVTESSHVTREKSSDDDWDRDDTHTDWSINGLRIGTNAALYGVPVGDVNAGDTVQALWAIYSTGDSFGSDVDGALEFIGVNKDPEIANMNYVNLNSGSDFFVNDKGESIKIYVPWNGYFESLTGIYQETFVVAGSA